MPKIPRYTQQVGLPATAPQPTINPNAVGGGWTNVTELADEAQRVIEEVREEQLAMDVMNRVATFSDEERDMLQNEFGQEGINARGSVERAQEWYEQKIDEYSSQIQDRRAQFIFQRTVMGRRNSGLNSLQRHELRQHDVYREETYKASVANAEQDVRAYAPDDERVSQVIMQNMGFIDAIYSGHQTDAVKKELTSALRAAQVQELIRTQPGMAAQVLEQHGDEIDGEVRLNLENALEIETRKAAMETAYNQAKSFFPGNVDAQLEFVNDTKNFPGLELNDRRQIANYLKSDYAYAKARQDEMEAQAREQVNNAFLQQYAGFNLTEKQILQNDTLTANMKQGWLNAVRAQREDISEADRQIALGEIIVRYHNQSLTPANLIEDFGGRVNPSDLRLWYDKVAEQRGDMNAASSGPALNQVNMAMDLFDREFAEEMAKGSKEYKVKKSQFIVALNEIMRKNELGKEDPEVYEVAKNLLKIYKEVKDWWPDKDYYGFEAHAENFPSPWLEDIGLDIPRNIRHMIIEKLNDRDLPVTEENIQRAYIRSFNSVRAKDIPGSSYPVNR